jgi:cytochrome c
MMMTACGGNPPPATTTAAEVNAPRTVDEQIALGQALYASKCAGCHGDSGHGKVPLVGSEALPLDPRPAQKARKEKFATALDVGGFVKRSMPADAPGTLSDTEAFAILAFDLHANGVKLDQVVNPAYAATIKLH